MNKTRNQGFLLERKISPIFHFSTSHRKIIIGSDGRSWKLSSANPVQALFGISVLLLEVKQNIGQNRQAETCVQNGELKPMCSSNNGRKTAHTEGWQFWIIKMGSCAYCRTNETYYKHSLLNKTSENYNTNGNFLSYLPRCVWLRKHFGVGLLLLAFSFFLEQEASIFMPSDFYY